MSQTPSEPENGAQAERKYITVSVALPKELVQEIKRQLDDVSMVVGFDFPIAKFASRVLAGNWKDELEKVKKSFKAYENRG